MLDLSSLSQAELDAFEAALDAERTRRGELDLMSDADLTALHARAADGLRRRGLLADDADRAGRLLAAAFGWSRDGADLVTPDGRRVAVRCRTVEALPPHGTFAVLADVDGAFDMLACLAFGAGGALAGAVLIVDDEVARRAVLSEVTGCFELSFDDAFRLGCGAHDIAAALTPSPAEVPPARASRRRRAPDVARADLRAQLAASLQLIGTV